jgi:hypothetical protein
MAPTENWTMSDELDPQRWIGFRVEDVYGARIGQVEDVLVEPDSMGVGTRWLLVGLGRFEGRHIAIPVDDAVAAPGHVWVPYERELVHAAPVAEPGARVAPDRLDLLRDHYGLPTGDGGTLVPASGVGHTRRASGA